MAVCLQRFGTRGRIDFFLEFFAEPDLGEDEPMEPLDQDDQVIEGWGFELFINGSMAKEHRDRFSSNGRYSAIHARSTGSLTSDKSLSLTRSSSTTLLSVFSAGEEAPFAKPGSGERDIMIRPGRTACLLQEDDKISDSSLDDQLGG